MKAKKGGGKINDGWEQLFEKFHIPQIVAHDGVYRITAEQIKQVYEPRLMSKFDAREALPNCFKEFKLSILPDSRNSYLIGNFDLYHDLPAFTNSSKEIIRLDKLTEYETIDSDKISSEANAINVGVLSGIFNDFFEEQNTTKGLLQTISGRMGSGDFDFIINHAQGPRSISVKKSQIEIDAGLESENTVVLIEAKAVVATNFLIRQLYYPYRVWAEKVQKPLRPLFMIYTNGIFHLLEYKFTSLKEYNSIQLIKEMKYSLEDTKITWQDLDDVYQNVNLKKEVENVPFIQADRFETVISLIEKLNSAPLTTEEIAHEFSFDIRQADYYYNAAKYLNLAIKQQDENQVLRVYSTRLGQEANSLKYKERQLFYLNLILSKKVFYTLYPIIKRGQFPDKNTIITAIYESETNVQAESTLYRRAQSVLGWLKWIVQTVTE